MAKKVEVKEEKPDKSIIYAPVTEESNTKAYGTPLKFDDSEQKSIIQDIKEAIDTYTSQRKVLGIEQEWTDAIDLYDGFVDYRDFPYENCHNLHIHLTSMTCDILLEKAKKRTFVKPMMILRPRPGKRTYSPESVQKKEKYLDEKIASDVAIEETLSPVYMDAIKLGTGIAKIVHTKNVETVRELEVYEPTDEDQIRFMADFDPSDEEYRKNLDALKNGETIELWVEKEVVTKNCPEVKHVDPFNLYLDAYVPIQHQRVIAEKIEDVTWKQLKNYFDTNYFDKKVETFLKDKYKGKDEYRKRLYTIFETNYLYKDKKGKEVRAIITFIDECDDRLARAITHPYITRRPNYEFYTIIDRIGCNYGVGVAKRLKDSNVILNELWNQSLDSGELNNAPMFLAKDTSKFDPTSKKYGPAVIWWLKDINDVKQFDHREQGREIYQIMEYAQRYAEWIIGVSAYMSGRESPIDPNAPASKAYMLLQEANIRINAYIRKIDLANQKTWFQLDRLYYQNFDEEDNYFGDPKESGDGFESITRKELNIPVQYIPQLSDISINKALEREENTKTGLMLLQFPTITQNPEATRKVLEIMLRSAGGEWDKQIDVLLPSEKETNVVATIQKLLKTMPPEAIVAIMGQLLQQSGKVPPNQATGAPMPGSNAGAMPGQTLPAGAGVPSEVIPT